MLQIDFLTPRLIGPRFEEHSVPLEFLSDLSVLEELLGCVAKAVWLEDHPGRKRTPQGFLSGVEIKLAHITDGSTILALKLCLTTTSVALGESQQNYLERARDRIIHAVSAAEAGENATKHLPSKALAYFDRFGRGLREGEAIEFDTPTVTARLTPISRRTLVLAAPGVEYITDEVVRRGRVVETNDVDATFTICLPGDRTVQGPLTPEHRDTILDAQKDAPSGVRVAVRGIGQFSRSNKLIRFEEVQEVTALDPLDVPARLDELRLLRQGWLDGSGKALNQAALDTISHAFTTHYPDNLPLPYTYPTPEGGIQFEWRLGEASPEIEISLDALQGVWSSDDLEAIIDLSTRDGWKELIDRVSVLNRAQPNGAST